MRERGATSSAEQPSIDPNGTALRENGAGATAPPSAQASEALEDRRSDLEGPAATQRKSGMLPALCCTVATVAGGVGFLFVYWTGGNNQLLGATLALFLGGAGAFLVLYARRLIVQREAIEPREELPSSPSEREEFAGDCHAAAHEASRRGLLAWMGAAVVAFVAAIVVSIFRSLGSPPGSFLFSTVWNRGQRLTTLDGTPVTIHALQQGGTMVVFPEDSIGNERAQTVLLRVDERLLRLPRERSDWAPMGYVAYSRVCTHAGCTVGLFEKTSDQLMCPCHQSTFDVLRAAQPTGGPAARPLPQLPLYADADGFLRARGGFSEPPGPGFWGMP